MTKVSYIMNVSAENQEMHIALLYEMGVESFIQNEDNIEAFVDLNLIELQNSIENYCLIYELDYVKKQHDEKDWNAEWESQFQPIIVNHDLRVRAPFHQAGTGYRHELIIAPKTAFGTGHHETTAMILEWLTTQNMEHKSVLDFGCGTGILGIYALLKGAVELVFADNDPLAVENTRENLILNKLQPQEIILGGVHEIGDKSFHFILANITRNVLTESLPSLVNVLKRGGVIALSGFLERDKDEMEIQLQRNGLQLKHQFQKEDWMCLIAER